MKNTIIINNTEYKIKQTLRALFIFEQITKRPFRIETLLDNYIYLYSIILANNDDNILEWDDFINALDDDNTIYQQLNDILEGKQKIEELMDGEVSDGDKKVQKKN